MFRLVFVFFIAIMISNPVMAKNKNLRKYKERAIGAWYLESDKDTLIFEPNGEFYWLSTKRTNVHTYEILSADSAIFDSRSKMYFHVDNDTLSITEGQRSIIKLNRINNCKCDRASIKEQFKDYKKDIIGEWIYTKNLITKNGMEIPVDNKVIWVFTKDKHYIILDGKKSKIVDYQINGNIFYANGDNQRIKIDDRGLIIFNNEVEMILFTRKR